MKRREALSKVGVVIISSFGAGCLGDANGSNLTSIRGVKTAAQQDGAPITLSGTNHTDATSDEPASITLTLKNRAEESVTVGGFHSLSHRESTSGTAYLVRPPRRDDDIEQNGSGCWVHPHPKHGFLKYILTGLDPGQSTTISPVLVSSSDACVSAGNLTFPMPMQVDSDTINMSARWEVTVDVAEES